MIGGAGDVSMANDRLISIQPPSHTMSNSNVANGARMLGQCPEIPQVLGCRRVPKRHADSAASRPAISRTPRQSEPATLGNVATHDRRCDGHVNRQARGLDWPCSLVGAFASGGRDFGRRSTARKSKKPGDEPGFSLCNDLQTHELRANRNHRH